MDLEATVSIFTKGIQPNSLTDVLDGSKEIFLPDLEAPHLLFWQKRSVLFLAVAAHLENREWSVVFLFPGNPERKLRLLSCLQ